MFTSKSPCPHCKKPMPIHTKICPHCGARLMLSGEDVAAMAEKTDKTRVPGKLLTRILKRLGVGKG